MRFKATLSPESVSLLHDLLTPLARLSSSKASDRDASWLRNGSLLRLDPESLVIVCQAKSPDCDGISCYAKLNSEIFLEHRIESRENNAIVMELDLAQFRQALSTTLQQVCSLKLAKRNGVPSLCLEAMSTVQVHHAIPVRMRKDTPERMAAPALSAPVASMHLPRSKPLRSIVEQIKQREGKDVYLSASPRTGELTVVWQGDLVLRTHWGRLTGEGEECSLRLDVKKLCAALQWQVQGLSAMYKLGFHANEQLVVDIPLEGVGSLTYYVPVLFMSDDPAED